MSAASSPNTRAPLARGSKQRQPRPAVFKNAILTFAVGARLAVVIKDLTDAGARVEFFVRIRLPDQVLLTESVLKLRRRARVVWQDIGAASLQFTDDAP